ncbi:Unknown protein, partial [Striga hermonthica]
PRPQSGSKPLAPQTTAGTSLAPPMSAGGPPFGTGAGADHPQTDGHLNISHSLVGSSLASSIVVLPEPIQSGQATTELGPLSNASIGLTSSQTASLLGRGPPTSLAAPHTANPTQGPHPTGPRSFRDAVSSTAKPGQQRELTTLEVVAQFRGFNAEKFSGQGDPRLVEEWIQGLESIFEITEYTDRHRILCAQLQMTGDARLWWNSYWGMRPGEKKHLTWIQFKKMLEEKYYPAHYRAEMERQFLALVQGNRSVGEYEREFTRLGSFVSYLIDTEAKEARRFQEGLLPVIRHHVAGHCIQTYAEVVTKDQEVDASLRRWPSSSAATSSSSS